MTLEKKMLPIQIHGAPLQIIGSRLDNDNWPADIESVA